MREILRIVGLVVGPLVLLQFFPVDDDAPPDSGPLVIHDAEVASIVSRACADCHTNYPDWPWYSQVAPVSWVLARHVREGRADLNFSTWGDLALRRQYSKLGQVVDNVESGEMPMPSYTWGHPDARLTQEERETLIQWAESLRVELRADSRGSRGGDDDGEARPERGGG